MGGHSTVLSREQVDHYDSDGYVVVRDLLTEDEVSAFLLHEETRKSGGLLGLHGYRVDPQYRSLATHPHVAGGASQLLRGRVRIVQTMFLDKPPAGGRGISLHQDCHYIPNEPNTLMACWIALTDTDPENGGLCVVPGSHRRGLRATHKAADAAEHAVWEADYQMRDRDGREWTQKMVSFEIEDLDPADIVRLTVPRGAGVFFTGMIIHGSFANRSADRPRPAFAVHYVREDTWVLRTDVQDTMLV
jgi:ectoine hydroxylase-related dioxygenase (phytanoyl-CoA dioxygenase family)